MDRKTLYELERRLLPGQEWEALTLGNDFMFGKVFQDTGLCLELVRLILPELNIERITLHERQMSAHETADTYGVRFDVYLHDSDGRIIIIEMQVAKIWYLPFRVRSYHSAADLEARESGKYKRYAEMPEVIVIFICEFDPFNHGRYVYTFRNYCSEDKDIALNDGATTIFLNTKGVKGEISPRLKAFLGLVEGKSSDDDFVRRIEQRLSYAKHNWEWRQHYVLNTLEMNSRLYDATEQGMARGMARGIVLGEKRGRLATIEDTVRLLREHGMSPEQIDSIRTSLLNEEGSAES